MRTVKNHGVPVEKVNVAFKASEEFFSLPIEEKMKVCNPVLYSRHILITRLVVD